jgi:hypothetical protein
MKIIAKYAFVTLACSFIAWGARTDTSFYPGSELSFSQEAEDWVTFNNLLVSYLTYPSSNNAKSLSEILLRLPSKMDSEGKLKALELFFAAESYPILENEMFAGDRHAVEMAFRLVDHTDGYYTGILLTSLGALVRINPKLFLEVLYENQASNFIKHRGYPVFRVGPGYYSRPKACKYELEMRIKALLSVEGTKYDDLKRACIERLLESIKKLAL